MEKMTRRNFVKHTAGASIGLFFASGNKMFAQNTSRLFKISLNPFAIGVNLSQEELLPTAVTYGFEAILPIPGQLAKMDGGKRERFLSEMKTQGISWDAAGLPVDFRKDDELFRKGMSDLPELADALQRSGVNRMSTWIMPTDQELTYLENFKR